MVTHTCYVGKPRALLSSMDTKTLTVTWFNDSKGYGFAKDGDRNIFVHYTAISGEGFKTLTKGQLIDCVIFEGPKGPLVTRATKVG